MGLGRHGCFVLRAQKRSSFGGHRFHGAFLRKCLPGPGLYAAPIVLVDHKAPRSEALFQANAPEPVGFKA